MRRATVLVLLPLLAGCVAPEEPVVKRPVRTTAQAPLPAGLEPAPLADRKMKAPESQRILQVDGMGKPKPSGSVPPI